MKDVEEAYNKIMDFLNSKTEKTLLLRGIADKEKHQVLLKALDKKSSMKGLVYLIHTTKDGIEDFFRWAEIYNVKLPKKYREGMKISNLTIYFDKLKINTETNRYDNYELDFMIIWPIQSVTKDDKEIEMLKQMSERQKTKKVIFLTIKEPWCNPEKFETFVDRVIKLDCENDNPEEYHRILSNFEDDVKRRGYYLR
jgi:glycerophosphoryl diester phosphodiesterase